MRTLGISLAFVLLLGLALRSDGQQDAARAIVDQAIQAHGGAEALLRTRSMVQASKGEITSFGAATPATCEVTIQPPDQCRWVFELEAGTQKVQVQLGINGDKGWRSSGGAVKEMVKPELEEQRERAYAAWLMTLLPLKDSGSELSPLPETKVGDDPAVGVQVKRKGRPDVRLWFDKKSHLLVKLERKTKDAGQDATIEMILGEPKNFDGIKLPTRCLELVNGKKKAEWTMTSCKFPGRLEEGVFAKP